MRSGRKRSAAITLVLAGSLSGCSEPVAQRDVYATLADCQRDWDQAQSCEPVRDGRYSTSWFYGPSYWGETWPNGRPRPNLSAVDAVPTGQRTVANAAPARYWGSSASGTSFRSSASSSSSVSRGGFGSSARVTGG